MDNGIVNESHGCELIPWFRCNEYVGAVLRLSVDLR